MNELLCRVSEKPNCKNCQHSREAAQGECMEKWIVNGKRFEQRKNTVSHGRLKCRTDLLFVFPRQLMCGSARHFLVGKFDDLVVLITVVVANAKSSCDHHPNQCEKHNDTFE